jgi:hypothetical protein
MNKLSIIITFIIAGAVMLIWLMLGAQEQHSQQAKATGGYSSPPIPASIKPNAQIPTKLSSGQDMFISQSPSEQPKIPTDNSQNDSIVWQLSEEGQALLKAQGLIPADVNNEAYVELDLAELNSVEVGDYLDLYIPQIGGSYTGEVDRIDIHSNGDRTVEAYIPGAGKLYSAVITIGKDAVYGTLGTQADVYILEGNGQYAWIASKSDLVATHSQSHVDSIVPKDDAQSQASSEHDPFILNTKASLNP